MSQNGSPDSTVLARLIDDLTPAQTVEYSRPKNHPDVETQPGLKENDQVLVPVVPPGPDQEVLGTLVICGPLRKGHNYIVVATDGIEKAFWVSTPELPAGGNVKLRSVALEEGRSVASLAWEVSVRTEQGEWEVTGPQHQQVCTKTAERWAWEIRHDVVPTLEAERRELFCQWEKTNQARTALNPKLDPEMTIEASLAVARLQVLGSEYAQSAQAVLSAVKMVRDAERGLSAARGSRRSLGSRAYRPLTWIRLSLADQRLRKDLRAASTCHARATAKVQAIERLAESSVMRHTIEERAQAIRAQNIDLARRCRPLVVRIQELTDGIATAKGLLQHLDSLGDRYVMLEQTLIRDRRKQFVPRPIPGDSSFSANLKPALRSSPSVRI